MPPGKNISDEIANFVERVHEETTGASPATSGGRGRHGGGTGRQHQSKRPLSAAENVIVQAEKFKAVIEPPKGNTHNVNSSEVLGESINELIALLRNQSGLEADNDDDFMHVTCHIDQALREKIGRGEFVDLDRLLPKTRTQIMCNTQDDIEVIRKDGATYVLPNNGAKESRITNVRRWEQAFRVYAAVYSEVNPSRSSEIWQYVHIINTASVSYAWENIAFYNFTFRQLMERKPYRLWAKIYIYMQMWNLAMTDHVQRSAQNSFGSGRSNGNPKSGEAIRDTGIGGIDAVGDSTRDDA